MAHVTDIRVIASSVSSQGIDPPTVGANEILLVDMALDEAIASIAHREVFHGITLRPSYQDTGPRPRTLLDVVRDTDTPTNRYVLTGDVGAPYGVIRVLPVYDEQDITKLENTLKEMKDTIEVKYLQVMQTVIGEWGYRRIDNTITRQYRIIESLNK